jgi:SlyX protein
MAQPDFLWEEWRPSSNQENTMSALPDPRIVSLEIEVAHHGKAIEELSAVVNQQYAEIERMRKKLDALVSRFLELEETAAPTIESAKPPHW